MPYTLCVPFSTDFLTHSKPSPQDHALLREMKAKHKKLIDTLNTGAKPEDKDNEAVLKVANEVAKTYAVNEKSKAPEKAE